MIGERDDKLNTRVYSYTTDDGNKVYITDDQAWEVEQQRIHHQYALDLLQTIREKHRDDAVLGKLIVEDLLPFTGKLEDMLEQDEGFDTAYTDCCESVIAGYVAEAFGTNVGK